MWTEVLAAIGGLIAGSVGMAAGVATALSRARAASSRVATERAPYRELPALGYRGTVADGPVVRCPKCDAAVLQCTKCGDVRTDAYPGWWHCRVDGIAVGVWSAPKSVSYLNFTHGTSSRRLCSPQRRVGTGFLWWHPCESDGLHVHQKCERCGWNGTARIASAHGDALRLLPAEQKDLGSRQFGDIQEESHASGETDQQEP